MVYTGRIRSSDYIKQTDRKTIRVVWACSKTTALEHACKYTIGMTPPGESKGGRPRTRWMDAVERDMEIVGLHGLNMHGG